MDSISNLTALFQGLHSNLSTAVLGPKLEFIEINELLKAEFENFQRVDFTSVSLFDFAYNNGQKEKLNSLTIAISMSKFWTNSVRFKAKIAEKSFDIYAIPLTSQTSYAIFLDRSKEVAEMEGFRLQANLFSIMQLTLRKEPVSSIAKNLIYYITSLPNLNLEPKGAMILKRFGGKFDVVSLLGYEKEKLMDLLKALNADFSEPLEVLKSLEQVDAFKGKYFSPLEWDGEFLGVFVFKSKSSEIKSGFAGDFIKMASSTMANTYHEYLQSQEMDLQRAELTQLSDALAASEEELRQQAEELMTINEQLNNQNIEITEEHFDLTSNITHALRLQRAILPNLKLISSIFPDSFLYYKPKDIVSGDFYWFHSIENQDKFLFLLGDSSGHGVSASFLSVIAIQILDRIAYMHKVFVPHLILERLDKEFNEILGIDHKSEVNDSMEIAIGLFEPKTRKFYYSSGNRPYFVIRDGELIILERRRQQIGGRHFKPFKVETKFFQLEKGDRLYTFTDGMVDQFGGEKDKKLGTKAFKDLLLSIHKKKMALQWKKINEFMEDWTIHNNQIDDITVAGMFID